MTSHAAHIITHKIQQLERRQHVIHSHSTIFRISFFAFVILHSMFRTYAYTQTHSHTNIKYTDTNACGGQCQVNRMTVGHISVSGIISPSNVALEMIQVGFHEIES